MWPKRNNAFVFIWTDVMIDMFLYLLEEANNNGKQSNVGFKSEV